MRYEIQVKFNESIEPSWLPVSSQQARDSNLQTCSDCVMHERQWNPGKEQQCEDRFARIGQEATSVNAIYAQLEGLTAIDQQFDVIVEDKLVRFHNTMNKTKMQKWNEDALMKELADAIVRGHNAKKIGWWSMDEVIENSFYRSRPSRHYVTRPGHEADYWPTVADYNNLNPIDVERECRAIIAGTLIAHSLGDFIQTWREDHVVNRISHRNINPNDFESSASA